MNHPYFIALANAIRTNTTLGVPPSTSNCLNNEIERDGEQQDVPGTPVFSAINNLGLFNPFWLPNISTLLSGYGGNVPLLNNSIVEREVRGSRNDAEGNLTGQTYGSSSTATNPATFRPSFGNELFLNSDSGPSNNTIYLNGDVSLTPVVNQEGSSEGVKEQDNIPSSGNQGDVLFITQSGNASTENFVGSTSQVGKNTIGLQNATNYLPYKSDDRGTVIYVDNIPKIKSEIPEDKDSNIAESSEKDPFSSDDAVLPSHSGDLARFSGVGGSYPTSVTESFAFGIRSPTLLLNSGVISDSPSDRGSFFRRKYECSLCGKRYYSYNQLSRHEELHAGKKTFPCKICGKEFTRENSLVTHSRIHSQDKVFKCEICGKGFYWKSCLTRHMGVHEDHKDFTCHICGKVFFNKSYVAAHISGVHTKDKKFKCEICGKGFAFEASLSKHKDTHVNGKNYVCVTCGKVFSKQCDLTLHRIMHTGLGITPSDYFSETRENTSSMSLPNDSHPPSSPLQNNMPESLPNQTKYTQSLEASSSVLKDRGFQSIVYTNNLPYGAKSENAENQDNFRVVKNEQILPKDELAPLGETSQGLVVEVNPSSYIASSSCVTQDTEGELHVTSIDGTNISMADSSCKDDLEIDSNRKFGCGACGKKFHSKANLLRHSVVHSGEKRFSCSICGKSFSREYNLMGHKRIHTAEKNYKCTLCGKGFYWKSCLTRHLDVHIDEKDFTCPICGKVFFNKSYVQGHMVVHTGEKRYKCDICGKGFSFNVSLRKHRMRHTEQKQYKCDICGKEFFQKSNLNLHRVVHTNRMMYACDFCGRSFSTKTSLTHHIAIHTGEFKCTLCDKSFGRSALLERHMATHNPAAEVELYECDLCDKKFKKKSNLLLHQVVHTGKKEFSCDICGRSYYHKFNLVQHMVIHTGNIKCSVCSKTFARESQLVQHMALHPVPVDSEAGEIFTTKGIVSDPEGDSPAAENDLDLEDSILGNEMSNTEENAPVGGHAEFTHGIEEEGSSTEVGHSNTNQNSLDAGPSRCDIGESSGDSRKEIINNNHAKEGEQDESDVLMDPIVENIKTEPAEQENVIPVVEESPFQNQLREVPGDIGVSVFIKEECDT